MKRVGSQIFLTVLMFLIAGFLSHAQIRESGTILGSVTDEGNVPLPGVTVTIESPNLLGGPQTMATDARGYYKFRSLAVGIYKVTAKIQGFSTMVKEGIVLHAGMTLTADFKMKQAKEEKEIIVVAEIPTIDIKSSQPKPIIFTDEFLNALPGKSSWYMIMSLAPGISQTYNYQGNAWMNDGINVFSAMMASAGYMPDTRILKEATVQSLGLPAEYGEFSGSVLSTITKSGSNKFSTFMEFTYYGKKWNSQNAGKPPLQEWYDPSLAKSVYATIPFYDYSGQVGGKILQDKLWFFAAVEYRTKKTPIAGLTKSKDSLAKNAFGKLSFQLNKSNKFNLTVNRNFQSSTNGAISVLNPDIGADQNWVNWFGSLNWTSIFSATTFLDVKAGYNYYFSGVMPQGGLDTPGIYDQYLRKYINNYIDATAQVCWNYHGNAHLSHYVPHFIKGSHDFKLGLEYLYHKILWDRKAPGNRIEYYYNGVPRTAEDRQHWYQDLYVGNFIAFVQDRWSLSDRVTLNLGTRLNHLRFYFPSESSSRGTVYNTLAIAPRLGISYDLLGDRKNIVKLSYSRYFEPLSRNWFGSFEHRYDAGAKYVWNAVTQKWDMTIPAIPYTAVAKIDIQSGINQPNVWEISGGYERELFRDASLALNFWWRELGDAMYVLYTDDVWGPYTTTNPGPDGLVGTADDKGPITIYQLVYRGSQRALLNYGKGNPPWMTWDIVYKDRALELRFTKRYSRRWQMMASYCYHRVTGNADGSYAGAGPLDPNININAYGERGFQLPHQFILQGNALLPLDISLSAMYTLMSGQYKNDQVIIMPPLYRMYPYIYVNPVGSKQADAVSNLDVKIEKQFRYRGFTFGVGLDVFNATNNYGGSGELYTEYGILYGKRYYTKTPRTFQMTLRIIY